ncbi:MAG: rhomboid family intramembrane serine protease [Bacteroidota bacterium]
MAFPPVIKNLLIINGLVFFAQMVPATNALLTYWFALWPFGTPDLVRTPSGLRELGDFYPWQLVTYGFLHDSSGFSHILINMFVLWMFGVRIENAWGSRRFAIYYFICVVGAGLAQLTFSAVTGNIFTPTVGASGGVMGVLLAFGMMYPNEYIYLYFLVPVKTKYFVIVLALVDLFSGFARAGSGVAHFAHLGGMFIGLVLILYWRGKLPMQPKQRMYW